MPVEECIITVCCWVEGQVAQLLQGVKLRQRGYAPRWSDTEVLPMEIVGAVLGYEGDEAIWEYCRRHGLTWFPGVGGRTTLSRQAANLWRMKQCVHPRLGAQLGADPADGHLIDGFPIPVCQLVRAPRRRRLTAESDYGYCAAKQDYYYGLNGPLLIDRRGVVTGITVTAAPVDERAAAYDGLTASEGLLLGDKGSIRPHVNAECAALGIARQTPGRRNLIERRPRWGLRLGRRWRKRIETVISPLGQRFRLARRRARAAWPLPNRLPRALVAHPVGVGFTLRLGRSPLDLDKVLVN